MTDIAAHAEIYYGNDVEKQLHAVGWSARPTTDYCIKSGLLVADLLAFIEATQPGHLHTLESQGRNQFVADIRNAISSVGTAAAFKHGIQIGGKRLRLCGFKPQFAATGASGFSDYSHNRFSVIREHVFNEEGLRLDFSLFLNGVPFATVELKSELSDQSADDAMEQYRTDRLPEYGVILRPREGAIAHFAVSQDYAAMTTRLQGSDTEFLWFNPNADYVKPHTHAYQTDYLWQSVFTPDSVLKLIEFFIFQKGSDVLFPRFHQWECVQNLTAAVLSEGVGNRYLQQHSAGSGKSNTISWLAYQLAYLTRSGTDTVFDKVLVVTDRLVLDKQLGGVLSFMQGGTIGQMTTCNDTKDLARALTGSNRIIVTTIQKFPWLKRVLVDGEGTDATTLAKVRKLKFAVIIDEAHSSQGGEFFGQMLNKLTFHTRSGRNTPNISFFAFTATPRDETMEIFGQKNLLGDLVPFHSYSMQQAIDEGYILDVRKGYHAVDVLYVVESTTNGPVEVKKPREIFRHIFEDEAVIKAKAREVLRVFSSGIAPLLEGEAQGMVVCNSRKAAGMFKLVLDELIKEQGLGFEALCAFTDRITIDDKAYDEFSINGLHRRFRSDKDAKIDDLFKNNSRKYKLLVVADKFQVGFDCPRLTALFVDKGLEGLAAVQTLSRLNRAFPHKDSTLVLDFVNDRETIQKAFDRYISPLETQPKDVLPELHKLRTQLEGFQLWKPDEVEQHWALFRKDPSGLYATVAPMKLRFNALNDERQKEVLRVFTEFRELYAFGSKICPEALDHQKIAMLVMTLTRYLDKREAKKTVRLPLKVVTATVVSIDSIEPPIGPDPGPVTVPSETRKPSVVETELSHLLRDLSRKSLSALADPIQSIIDDLSVQPTVILEAQNNVFDTFAKEGVTGKLLSRAVTSHIMCHTSTNEEAETLLKALVEDTPEARDTRKNLLRVVYLRARC